MSKIDESNAGEYGACPNCGSAPVHVADLCMVGDKICCPYCYQDELEKLKQ